MCSGEVWLPSISEHCIPDGGPMVLQKLLLVAKTFSYRATANGRILQLSVAPYRKVGQFINLVATETVSLAFTERASEILADWWTAKFSIRQLTGRLRRSKKTIKKKKNCP